MTRHVDLKGSDREPDHNKKGGVEGERVQKILKDDHRKALFRAVTELRSVEECEGFFADLCTPREVDDFAERWLIARLLDDGASSYRDISAATGASTTTVGRVARFLQQERHAGYRLILDRLFHRTGGVGDDKPGKKK
jgi:TrpR-related protein YerC/YecD